MEQGEDTGTGSSGPSGSRGSGGAGAGHTVFPGFADVARRRRAVIAELVEARQSAGLSQTTVAARMGTSQPVVARLESGDVDARLSTLARYAAAVGRDLDMHVRSTDGGPHAPRPSPQDPRPQEARAPGHAAGTRPRQPGP